MKKKWIFILGLCIQIIASFFLYCIGTHDAHFDGDSYGYDRIAWYYAQHSLLRDPHVNTMPVQTMGYPLLLGICYKIFGHWIGIILLMQLLCVMGISSMIFYLAYHLFNERVAYGAFLLASCNLGYLIFAQFILADIVLACTLLLATMSMYYVLITGQYIFLILNGLLCGFSMLLKPVIVGWLIILSIFLLVRYQQITYFKKLIMIFLFWSTCALPLIIYMNHNKKMFGTFILAPVAHESLYIYFLAKLLMHEYGLNQQEAFAQCYILSGNQHEKKQWERSREALQWFISHRPYLVIKTWVLNVCKTLGGFYTSQLKLYRSTLEKNIQTSFFATKDSYYQRLKNYIRISDPDVFVRIGSFIYLLYFMIQFLSILLALFLLIKNQQYALLSFFLFSIIYFSGLTGHDGCARFRIMFEWIYIVLAAYGIDHVIYSIRLRTYKIWLPIISNKERYG